jgi:hypothetical protein
VASKIKVDTLETADGTGSIALSNQFSGMTTASLPSSVVTEDASGNVGMGGNLDVDGSVNSTGEMRITNPSANSQLYLYGASGHKANIILNEYGVRAWHVGAGTFSSGRFTISDGSTERIMIHGNGNVCLGSSDQSPAESTTSTSIRFGTTGKTQMSASSDYALIVNRVNSEGGVVQFRQAGGIRGSISVGGSATAYNTSSDYRLKENVVPMSGSIDRLKELKPSRFNFIADADTTVDGFLAHEAQAIVPECVTGEKDAMRTEDITDEDGNVTGTQEVPDMQGIDQAKLVPLLTSALQDAIAKIEQLESRISALEVN